MNIFFDLECVSDLRKEWDEEKFWEKINFMPEKNKIITICMWVEISWVMTVKNLEWNERTQIEAFFKAIKWNILLWWNIKNFDIPFIIKRALYYCIPIPNELKIFWKKPREIENIIDLKDIYNYNVFWNFCSLDLVCSFLWITSPKSWWINWSEVQKFYDEWKETVIIEYCKRDVQATIEVFNYFKKYNLC
jgi:hypothetical protein